MELPASTNTAPSTKRLRVLCLHGYRTSAGFLEQQLSNKWDNSLLQELLDLNFLDAPFPCKGKSDIEGIFPPPFYEWFQYNIIFTEFTGLEECIEYISNYMYEYGPFDGLLGFSQGAVLCAALAGLQQKGLALSKHPRLQFVLIISGAMFKNIKVKEDCYSEIIRCPSVHFIGSKDWLKPKNEELRQVFEEPVVLRHGAKHSVPRLDKEAIAVLRNFLTRFQTCRGHDLSQCDRAFEHTEPKNEDILQEEHHLDVTHKFMKFGVAKHEGVVQDDFLSEIKVAA